MVLCPWVADIPIILSLSLAAAISSFSLSRAVCFLYSSQAGVAGIMSFPLVGPVSVVNLSVARDIGLVMVGFPLGQDIRLVSVILRLPSSVPGQLQLALDLSPGGGVGILEAGHFRASVTQYQDRNAGLPQPLQVPQHLPVFLSLAPLLAGDVSQSLVTISLSLLPWV